MTTRILVGDMRERLAAMPAASVDSCVTDPPYGLTTGKKGGTGVASINLDSPYGRSRIGTGNGSGGFMGQAWDGSGVETDPATWAEVFRVLKPGAHLLAFGGTRTVHRIACAIEDAGFEIRDQIAWMFGSGFPKSHNLTGEWDGWGTALKPAYEPVIVARKPFRGTVAANVTEHGTGAINVDGCRIDLDGDYKSKPNGRPSLTALGDNYDPEQANKPDTVGRWPANVVLDEEAGAVLDAQTGVLSSNSGKPFNRTSNKFANTYGTFEGVPAEQGFYGDTGGASRFFYCAKADGTERGHGNNHPTVKPVALMRWLVRLVTPPGGTVVDPFMGSGTTGMACDAEGFDFIGVELSADYADIAEQRIRGACPMFADVERIA